ncbi:hypothetical protein [Paracoccus suum]|uniref:hypothetical protein n=1 Tax=Paracoccus suum TaxID=2259340 RepID=UPI0013B0674A|nr:hypothetical protein [Paracoccus suum]
MMDTRTPSHLDEWFAERRDMMERTAAEAEVERHFVTALVVTYCVTGALAVAVAGLLLM